jgi:sortase A
MKEKTRGRRISTILLTLVLLIGIGLLIYPPFSEYWNSFHQSRAIISYAEKVANLDKEKYEQIWNAALQYNRSLTMKSNHWAIDEAEREEYDAQLNVDGTGNMGFISIPKADINLPLYHGTNESVLQTSVGHIEGTSLPAGSIHSNEEDFNDVEFASHCVLSGHRGLPSARLFSDLDMMEVGDLFYLTVLDQTLTYEVDEINIVEPDDSSKIELVPGMDLVTLVTCTPYGINTHRLLVRGRRIENEKTRLNVRVTADAIRIEAIFVAPFIAAPVLLLLVFWVIIITSGRRRR